MDTPDGAALGLSFAEIVGAFRADAMARDVVANLLRASHAKKAAAGLEASRKFVLRRLCVRAYILILGAVASR